MVSQAFSAKSITESIVAFAQYSRAHGLNIGLQETQDALIAAENNLLTNRLFFKSALQSIFCTSPEECILFETLYTRFWDTNPMDIREEKNKTALQGAVSKKTNASVVMLGKGNSKNNETEGKEVSGANEAERLKKTDLSKISEIEADELEEIARKLFREMAIRLRRRMKTSRKPGLINLRRTIRKSIAYGGEPFELFTKSRTPKKQRLIVLLDVSGSMDKYSSFLLRFICALRENFRQLEAFIFSTSLVRISKALQYNRMDMVLAAISKMADSWSGGTKIGHSLLEFNNTYGKAVLNGSPVVIIMSDGLDTGDIKLLEEQMNLLRKKAKKIVWLNPLKGMKGYQPIASGMKAALPAVTDFYSAHNLDSILDLENILADA
jgi:uncharacterized protein with von Willebrand factor type A (vWA) domain